jgi:hypothetical protein
MPLPPPATTPALIPTCGAGNFADACCPGPSGAEVCTFAPPGNPIGVCVFFGGVWKLFDNARFMSSLDGHSECCMAWLGKGDGDGWRKESFMSFSPFIGSLVLRSDNRGCKAGDRTRTLFLSAHTMDYSLFIYFASEAVQLYALFQLPRLLFK